MKTDLISCVLLLVEGGRRLQLERDECWTSFCSVKPELDWQAGKVTLLPAATSHTRIKSFQSFLYHVNQLIRQLYKQIILHFNLLNIYLTLKMVCSSYCLNESSLSWCDWLIPVCWALFSLLGNCGVCGAVACTVWQPELFYYILINDDKQHCVPQSEALIRCL